MPSFDIVSKVQRNEVDNAYNQAQKEIAQRFDFKDTETELEKSARGHHHPLGQRRPRQGRARRAAGQAREAQGVAPLHRARQARADGKGGARIVVKIKEGIEVEKARAIVQTDQGVEAQGAGLDPGGQVRVTGKNKDDLQAAIQSLRAHDFGIELQFVNLRD